LLAIMKDCPLFIHDLCRVDEPRVNLPFEGALAIGLGAHAKGWRRALILIASTSKFDRAYSDLRGSDAHQYRGARGLVVAVTRWLRQFFEQSAAIPNAAARRFQRFWRAPPQADALNDRDDLDLTWAELQFVVLTWLTNNAES
jgi:hypothetical protein